MMRRLSVSHSVVSDFLRPHGLQPTRLLCPWDFSGKNTGVGWHSLLQGIFPTQGSNPGLLHCRRILNLLRHQGSPYDEKVELNIGSLHFLLRATVRGLEQPWNCDKWPLTSQQEGWSSRPVNREAWTASPSGEPTLDSSFTEAQRHFHPPGKWGPRVVFSLI